MGTLRRIFLTAGDGRGHHHGLPDLPVYGGSLFAALTGCPEAPLTPA
ncbi:hypothetical protein [Massilia consociata]